MYAEKKRRIFSFVLYFMNASLDYSRNIMYTLNICGEKNKFLSHKIFLNFHKLSPKVAVSELQKVYKKCKLY
jgi:hypothetical protein